MTASGSLSQPIQWGSEVWDSELGLVYYNWRYYTALDARWVNRDSYHKNKTENLYAYSKNAPITFTDRLGLDVWVENTMAALGWHWRVCVDTWEEVMKDNCVMYKKKDKYCISFAPNDDLAISSAGSQGSQVSGSIVSNSQSSNSESSRGCSQQSVSASSNNYTIENPQPGQATGKYKFEYKKLPPGMTNVAPTSERNGSVYEDNETWVIPNLTYFSYNATTDALTDIEIQNYLASLVGLRDKYNISGQNCRAFSSATFNEIVRKLDAYSLTE